MCGNRLDVWLLNVESLDNRCLKGEERETFLFAVLQVLAKTTPENHPLFPVFCRPACNWYWRPRHEKWSDLDQGHPKCLFNLFPHPSCKYLFSSPEPRARSGKSVLQPELGSENPGVPVEFGESNRKDLKIG